MDRPLAVGAIIDSAIPATWITELLSTLASQTVFKLIVVQTDPPESTPAPPSPVTIVAKLARRILSNTIDKPLFPEDPLLEKPLPATLRASPATTLSSCDVVLNLTDTSLPANWRDSTLAPIWCAHTETLNARVESTLLARAPLLWVHLWSEPTADTPVTRIASHALPRQTYSLTDLQHAAYFCLPSLFESRLHWLAAHADFQLQETGCRADMAASVVRERTLVEMQAERYINNAYQPEPSTPLATLINVFQLLWHQSVERFSSQLWYDQWQLASFTHDTGEQSVVDQMALTPVENYTALPTPDRTWWADPQLFEHEQRLYVFFEEMQVDGTHGHLSVARLQTDGQMTEIHPVVNEQTHLSYPFVFSHNDQIYMMPETASTRKITLYKSHQFPDQWHPDVDLLDDVDLADSTVYFHDSYWWMFTNSQSHRTVNERDELRVYYAKELQGPWMTHPMNPVLTGVDRARMAGPLFADAGQLYRVSQYGAHRYGFGVNLNRIDALSTTEYRETPVHRITPNPDSPWLGCHSISHLNGVTVLDRLRRRRRF